METLRAENNQLRDRNQQLEAENALLVENSEKLRQQMESLILETEVLQRQIQELSNAAPNLEEVRDRILKDWRLARGPEKKERIKEAIDRFIKELRQ